MMDKGIQIIPFARLVLAFLPAFVVVGVLYKWSQGYRNGLYAISRMLVQLMLVGYFLAYIFESKSAWVVLAVLAVMVFISSWIALRTIKEYRRLLYGKAFCSILLGGGATLLLITQGVLKLQPWYWANYVIPLAGMIFANAMNSVSLAADRLEAEIARDMPYEQARNIAFRASLIPITNSLLAVGLVSLPG